MTAPLTVVLFGATGDLSRRKLIPGLLHLFLSGLVDDLRVVGTSLDDISVEEFRELAADAATEFSVRETDEESLRAFAQRLDYVPGSAGPEALRAAVERSEEELEGEDLLRLHYLSVPPRAALKAVGTIAAANLVELSLIHI